jgi:hypothetical protein
MEGEGGEDTGPVTLGLRGQRRTPSRHGEAGASCSAAAASATCEQNEDPFAHMNPAQARAARIRRDRALAAKAAACEKLKERVARQNDEVKQGQPLAERTRAESKRDPRLATSPVTLVHGQHFPHGFQAVEYAYGNEGTWKRLCGLCYESNLFIEHGREALALKCTSQQQTCCDRDGNVLCDPERVGHVQQSIGGSAHAFHEHNGLSASGAGGIATRVARPSLLFSFDDNVLGNCIGQIYSKPTPDGVEASNINNMNKTFCR